MLKHNAENERIKAQILRLLEGSEALQRTHCRCLRQGSPPFRGLHKVQRLQGIHFQQAVAFKNHLADQKNVRSGDLLSKATLNATLTQLKRFFQWLSWQTGYKARLQHSDADYFNLSEKAVRVATARREPRFPTIEQVKHVIAAMPSDSEIEKRNRALVAFTLLTGARDGAIRVPEAQDTSI